MKRESLITAAALSLLALACQLPGRSGRHEPASKAPASDEAQAPGPPEEEKGVLTTIAEKVERVVEGPKPVVLPAGTRLKLTMATSLSSGTSQEGDEVLATVTEPVMKGDHVVIPEGSELRGKVLTSVGSGRVKGRGRLVFRFDEVVVKGREQEIPLSSVDITAKSAKKRDAAMIGGGAAAGAVVGAIADGKKGAAIGAAVGAGAGTGAALATKGAEAQAPSGSTFTVKTTRDGSVRVG
jgi:hypothetical protein